MDDRTARPEGQPAGAGREDDEMLAEFAQCAPAANHEAPFNLFVRGTDMMGESFGEAAASGDTNSQEFYMILHHQVEINQKLDITISFTSEEGSPRDIPMSATVSSTKRLDDGTWGVAFKAAPRKIPRGSADEAHRRAPR